MEETYSELFIDCLLAALIFPFQGELFLPAMMVFAENYNNNSIFLYAAGGGILGLTLNYAVGYAIISLSRKRSWFDGDMHERYEKGRGVFLKYLVWLLILSGIGFSSDFYNGDNLLGKVLNAYGSIIFALLGGIFTLTAGIFRTPIYIFLPLIIISKASYYYLIIL